MWVFVGMCVGFGMLIVNWQIVMMMQIVVVIEVYQMFDVYVDFVMQVIFGGDFCDFVMQLIDLFVVQVFDFGSWVYVGGCVDVLSSSVINIIDVGQ